MSDLSNLKVGDVVIQCDHGGWNRNWTRAKVEKIGKLHITVLGARYRMHGASVGYRNGSIMAFDQAKWDEYVREVRDRRATRRLETTRWGTVDINTIHAVCRLLDADSPDAEEAQCI